MRRKVLIGVGLFFALCVALELSARAVEDPTSPDFVFDVLDLDTQVVSWWHGKNGGFEGENGWISINAQGWRGTAPFVPARTPGVRRIVVAGTGNVFGENLADEQTWPERLEQVLLNLLLNAADAIGGGAGRITVSALAGADSVELAIEDTGGGIDDGVRDQVFEPFVTTKDVGKGTGLGLAVCRGLVESVGGTIHVDDGADGARFVLTLPHASSAS